jgi:hypothetical protein
MEMPVVECTRFDSVLTLKYFTQNVECNQLLRMLPLRRGRLLSEQDKVDWMTKWSCPNDSRHEHAILFMYGYNADQLLLGTGFPALSDTTLQKISGQQ